MKNRIFNRQISLTLFIVVNFAISIAGQSGGTFVMQKSVIAGGGGQAVGGTFVLDGTIGQSVAGVKSTGGGFELGGGFWGGGAAPAADVTVSGRVLTPDGRSLRNTIVSLIDSAGVRRFATSSSFGVYSFANVRPGEVYTMTVTSKRYRFTPLIMPINSSLSNVDFFGLE